MDVTREPVDRPAPGRLELVRAFVNTQDMEKGTDRLGDPGAAATWLGAAELLPAGAHVGRDAFAWIVQVREAFRAVLVAHADGGPAHGAVEVLNEVAADAGVVARLCGPDEAAPVVTAGGIDGAMGHLVAIAFEAIGHGRWSRLKACPAEACRWAFFDASRNRSSRWCDMGLCGNRAKRETFEKRRKAA